MKNVLLFIAIIFSFLKADAKKIEFPITVIAASADLIVVGEIVSVENNSYTFKISETLKGKSSSSISVKMFEEWTCDIRYDKPRTGQKLCLFLKKNLSNWEIINGSNGELRILANSITLGPHERYDQTTNKFIPYIISLPQFKNGISAFCKCYTFIGEYVAVKRGCFSQMGGDDKINKFKLTNDFSAWLYKQILHYRRITS